MHPPRFGDLPTAKQRKIWQKASSDADWTAAQGPLGPLILKQRSRAFRADKFASWLMGALIVTIFFGLGYYVGVPLWQQIQDGERRAYLAEANLLETQLLDMDRARNAEWDALLNQLSWIGTQRESGVAGVLTHLQVSEDGQTLVAVGGNIEDGTGVITRSTDGGDTWQVRESGVVEYLNDLKVIPIEKTLVGIGNGGVISRSTDGGDTWQARASGVVENLLKLQILPDNKTLIAIGSSGAITRSTDGGDTWQVRESGVTESLLALGVLHNGQTLVAVGGDRLSFMGGVITLSTDGGNTWQARESGVMGNLRDLRVLKDGQTLVAVGGNLREGQGVITRSTDGGKTWLARESGIITPLEALEVLPDGQTLIAISSFGTIVRSIDGGDTWQVRESSIGAAGAPAEFLVLNDGHTLIAPSSPGTITRSTDSGNTWQTQKIGFPAYLYRVRKLRDGQTLFALGFLEAENTGIIARSTDGGNTWQTSKPGLTLELFDLRVLPGEQALIAFGHKGTVVLIDDRYKQKLATENIDAGYLGDAKMRELIDELPDHVADSFKVPTQINKIDTAAPIEERLAQEAQLKRAQAAADQIASGGFSLEQRRDDFASFLKVCREGAASTEKSNFEKVEATDGATTKETSERTNVDVTTACSDAYIALRQAETQNAWQILSQRAPQAILLLFLLATLGGLYRYNVRLAGFYHARADALELVQNDDEWTPETLANLGQTLGADKVEFGKSNTPTDQAIEMAKAILSRK